MTKVDIISGFLGAGKTTLIKKLIAESFAGQQVVLIENEFGEIGIDSGFLKDAGINITEMNSGCICCSLVGDFGKALKEVVDKYHPARIIIEPSGVGKLSDVARAVENVDSSAELVVNSLVTVVDGNKAKMYMKNFGEFFNNQVESAGTIIISRSQNMKDGKMDELEKLLREHNKEAVLVTTPWDDIKGDQIIAAMENGHTLVDSMLEEFAKHADEDEHEHHHHHHDEEGHEHHHHHDEDEHEHHHHDEDEHEHHHHHDEDEHEHHHEHGEHCHCGHHHHHDADEVFTSWGEETSHKFDEEALKTILEALAKTENNEYGIILRAKGYVPMNEGSEWLHFDLTPGEYEIRHGSADYTGRLCVIGSELKEDKIRELFGV
ncbi:CobW family GTP-binding protein [Lachnospiraceae bacterium C1.1]|nr:GTP-binding protein [Lachnospiraceae bacterium C1.1]